MKFYLQRVRLDRGGYDHSGRYFGRDMPLYYYDADDGEHYDWIRAHDREDAKARIRRAFPTATFFN